MSETCQKHVSNQRKIRPGPAVARFEIVKSGTKLEGTGNSVT